MSTRKEFCQSCLAMVVAGVGASRLFGKGSDEEKKPAGTKAEKTDKAMEALRSVGLADFAGHYPWQLSGGMQQRAALARGLAYGADILLLDEPFASVDAQTREELEDLLAGVALALFAGMVCIGSALVLARRVRGGERELRDLDLRLLQSQKLAAIGELSSGIAHEINNPLAIINEKAGLMKDILTMKDVEFPLKAKFLAQVESVLRGISAMFSPTTFDAQTSTRTFVIALHENPALMLGMGYLTENRIRTQVDKTLEIPMVGAEHAPNLVKFLATNGMDIGAVSMIRTTAGSCLLRLSASTARMAWRHLSTSVGQPWPGASRRA